MPNASIPKPRRLLPGGLLALVLAVVACGGGGAAEEAAPDGGDGSVDDATPDRGDATSGGPEGGMSEGATSDSPGGDGSEGGGVQEGGAEAATDGGSDGSPDATEGGPGDGGGGESGGKDASGDGPVCADGALQCSGQQPQICKGGQWKNDGKACVDSACSAGTCIGTCTPGALECDLYNVLTCNAEGQWSLTSLCDKSQTCRKGVCGPPCDIYDGKGCPSGDKCDPTSYGNSCEPNGTVADGQACAQVGEGDNCAGPGICLGYSSGPQLCLDLCTSSAGCTQPPVASGSTPEPANVANCNIPAMIDGFSFNLCSYACNPVTTAGASGCLAGLACSYHAGGTPPEYTNCQPAGTVAEGGDCSSSGCAAGLICIYNGTADVCRQVCRNAQDGDCSVSGDVCVPPSGVTTPMFGFCCSTSGC